MEIIVLTHALEGCYVIARAMLSAIQPSNAYGECNFRTSDHLLQYSSSSQNLTLCTWIITLLTLYVNNAAEYAYAYITSYTVIIFLVDCAMLGLLFFS